MGKLGLKDCVPYRTANRPPALQTGLQFLTKDFLRFWIVDIRRGYRPAPANRHKPHAPDWCRETEAGTAEGIRCTTPGESALV